MKLNEVLNTIIEYDRPDIDLDARKARDSVDIPTGRTSQERGYGGNESEKRVNSEMQRIAKELLGQEPEVLGNGNFAVAFGDSEGKGAARVTKRARSLSDLEQDGYLAWVGSIVKSSEHLNNPYLPRYYNVKFYRNSESKIAYVIELEKLESYDDLDNDPESHDFKMMQAALEKLINDPDDYYYTSNTTEDIAEHITGYLSEAQRGTVKIKNKKLKKAMELVLDAYSELGEDGNVITDYTMGNVMYRRSPYGFDIVLVDPVYG